MSAEQLGSLDINSFRKKKKKHHSTTPLERSKTPAKHSHSPPKHSKTPTPSTGGAAVNPAAQTAQQPAQLGSSNGQATNSAAAQTAQQGGSGQEITMTQANPATATKKLAPAAAMAAEAYAQPTSQDISRLKVGALFIRRYVSFTWMESSQLYLRV
jgi:hypothetical protein